MNSDETSGGGGGGFAVEGRSDDVLLANGMVRWETGCCA